MMIREVSLSARMQAERVTAARGRTGVGPPPRATRAPAAAAAAAGGAPRPCPRRSRYLNARCGARRRAEQRAARP
eukprot:scaffold2910_cov390-Prasinococcus_capsulatus_cf.AAC.71